MDKHLVILQGVWRDIGGVQEGTTIVPTFHNSRGRRRAPKGWGVAEILSIIEFIFPNQSTHLIHPRISLTSPLLYRKANRYHVPYSRPPWHYIIELLPYYNIRGPLLIQLQRNYLLFFPLTIWKGQRELIIGDRQLHSSLSIWRADLTIHVSTFSSHSI